MCPNAKENGQIDPSTTVRATRGDGSRPNLASILREARKTANIQASSGVIWGIPATYNQTLAELRPLIEESTGLKNVC